MARPQAQQSQAFSATHDVAIADLRRRILAWYETHGRDLPWRRTCDPYAILVSEIMLQQTQVSRVLPRYEEWLHRFPRLEDLAAAQLDEVLRYWRGLGYNNRAQRLYACAAATAAAADEGPATLPETLPELVRLPGIGPYTARAILVFAHNRDVAAVDTNVRRVLLHELGLPPDLSSTAVQALAEAALPRGRSRDWHNALMDYGAEVLTARATGISPARRQSPFVGSRRWQRSRLLRAVLDGEPQTVEALAKDLGLSSTETGELVDLLEKDGLVRRRGELIHIA